jgi:hypothetical protein
MTKPVGGVVHKPNGYAQYANMAAAIDLATNPTTGPALPESSVRALIQAEGADVRWADDGTTPTASLGMIIPNGVVLEYEGDLSKIKLIQAAASAKLNVSYYRL